MRQARLAAGVETLVRVVDVGLFVSEIGVLLGHNGSRNAIGVSSTHAGTLGHDTPAFADTAIAVDARGGRR